jgi:hypothetical protein
MTVVFKGGNSGSRGENFLPPTPNSGYSQPIQKTQTYGSAPGTVNWAAENFKPHVNHATPDFMPVGGTDSTGTDHSDPTATTGGDESVFVNTTYTGIK